MSVKSHKLLTFKSEMFAEVFSQIRMSMMHCNMKSFSGAINRISTSHEKSRDFWGSESMASLQVSPSAIYGIQSGPGRGFSQVLRLSTANKISPICIHHRHYKILVNDSATKNTNKITFFKLSYNLELIL